MGIQDFLFGEPDQTGQLDPRIQSARNFLLQEMLKQYAAGPVNVPTYQAVIPQNMYSGTNDLLSSLGFSPVSVPSMPTTNIGGIEAYTTQPIQEAMQGQSSVGGGGSYGSFQGSGVAGVGTGGSSSGGGGAAIPLGASRVPYSTLTQPQLDAYSQDIAGSVGMDTPFDPSSTAREQMTDAQYSNYTSQPMSNPGQQAADAIYMNNLARSGSGSLATGRATGGNLFGSLLGGAEAILDVPVLGDIAGLTTAGKLAQMAIDRYGQAGNPDFDPSDPSTFMTASGQNANEAFQRSTGGGLFSKLTGGYTGLKDMFDGGGPGASSAPTATVAPKPVYTAPATSGAGVEKRRQAAANTLAAQSRAAANPAQIKAKRAQGMALSATEQAAVNAAKAGGLGWMYM